MNARKADGWIFRFSLALLLGAFLLTPVSKLSAQTTLFEIETKLLPPDLNSNLFFGFPVVIHSNTAAIGALDLGQTAVYVFGLSGTNWVATQKLTDPNTNSLDQFGAALDLQNDLLVIGQPHALPGNLSGQAYVYRRVGSTWVLEQTLTESNIEQDQLFGSAVGVSGQTIAVGDPQEIFGFEGFGVVNVYTQSGTNWIFQAQLTASDATINSHFGGALAIDGDTILVAAVQTPPAGAAYVFVRSGTNWTQQQKIVSPEISPSPGFGGVVALEGNVAVVSDAAQNVNGTNGGAVYIFVRSGTTWTFQQRLVAPTNEDNLSFGQSVAIHNGEILVGTPQETINGQVAAGAAYLYRFSGSNWDLVQKLTASDAANPANFGRSVDLNIGGAIVGAPFDHEVATNSGAAYIYSHLPLKIVSASASPNVLFPPNHKLVPVKISVTTEGSANSCRIISVESNEPSAAKGNGKHEPDWIITGDLTLLLRAERSGQAKQGRIYTITIECSDEETNSVRTNVLVTVPHDARSGLQINLPPLPHPLSTYQPKWIKGPLPPIHPHNPVVPFKAPKRK